MTESPEELAAVEQLLAESESLHGWLARIDAAAGAAPDAVRQRVRADYQRRLDDVTAGLRAHADVIGGKLQADRGEHATLQARAEAAREALAEAELRHAVGEYDSERVDGERRRHGSDIETYQLSLDAVAERIARLEEIHALVERGPRADQIDLDPVFDVIEVAEIDAPAINEAPPVGIADLAPDAEEALGIFEDFTAESTEEARPDAAEPQTLETGPLSFRPSANGAEPARVPVMPPTRSRPFESAPPLGIPAADIPPRFVRPGERLGGHPAPPAVTPAAEPVVPPAPLFGEEIVASGTVSEVTAAPVGRTLRCGECGAMNRPLEWYCEKCGAELTAV